MSSKQTSATSSGTSRPASRTASIAPTTTMLLTEKTAVGGSAELEQPPHALARPRPGRRSSRRRVVVDRNARPRQRLLVAAPAVARGRDLVRLDDQPDRVGARARSDARPAAGRPRRCRPTTASPSTPGSVRSTSTNGTPFFQPPQVRRRARRRPARSRSPRPGARSCSSTTSRSTLEVGAACRRG